VKKQEASEIIVKAIEILRTAQGKTALERAYRKHQAGDVLKLIPRKMYAHIDDALLAELTTLS